MQRTTTEGGKLAGACARAECSFARSNLHTYARGYGWGYARTQLASDLQSLACIPGKDGLSSGEVSIVSPPPREAKLNAEANDLEHLLDEAVQLQTPSAPPPRTNGAIQKVRYTHDAMVDLIIANPAISQNELAHQFGYSAGWVSQILASDAFQAKLLSRTTELVDPTIRATVEDRFKALVLRSMDILRAKLDAPPEAISDNLTLRTLELSSRALGYGARAETAPTPPAEVHLHLDTLGERLVGLLRQKKLEAIEGSSTEVSPA